MRRGVAVLGTVILCAAAFMPSAANAAADTAGPDIVMQSTGHLITPSPVRYWYGHFSDYSQVYETTVEARWKASDPSGICDTQVWNDSGRDVPTFIADIGKATSYRLQSGDLDESNGGYNQTNIEVRVEDCAGNWTVSGYNCTTCDPDSGWPFPASDRALNLPSNVNYLYSHDDANATYSTGNAWTHSFGAVFVGGSNSHAVKAGASVVYTYVGATFGWISERGPNRGSARVYQDGVLKAIVNLNTATNTGPQVVWSNWFAKSGTHTIKIVVVGTAGHPRVDVDGFFTGPQYL